MSDTLKTDVLTVPAAEEDKPQQLADVPSTQQPQYFCVLTDAGSALEADAHAAGKPVRLSMIALGDGNGQVPVPKASVNKLVH